MTRIGNVRNITKFKRSIRAISPVIATLLMIAIAVVASLVVYAWVTGYIGGTSTTSGNAIQIQSSVKDGNTYRIYVQNVGQGPVTLRGTGSVYINDQLASIGAADVTIDPTTTREIIADLTGITLVSGESVKIKVVADGGTFAQETKTGTSTTGGGGPPGNNAPVINTINPTDTTPNVNAGDDLAFSVTATDDDVGDTLTYAWYLDGSVQADIDNTYTYSSASGTTHTILVEVSDGKVTTPTSQSWDVTVDTVTPTRQTIFTDDFEGGWLSQWPDGDRQRDSIVTSRSNTPTHSAQIQGNDDGDNGDEGEMRLEISTIGYTDIQVSYWRWFDRGSGSSSDTLTIEWRVGTSGGTWYTLESLNSDMSAWAQSSTFSLPISANGKTAIQIRFQLEDSENSDYAFFDDVLVTGIA